LLHFLSINKANCATYMTKLTVSLLTLGRVYFEYVKDDMPQNMKF